MSQPQGQPSQLSAVLWYYLNELKWVVLGYSIKALFIFVIWNYLLQNVFTMLPVIKYGHAFGMVALVAVLFGNLNGHSKYQTRHLYDIKDLLVHMLRNQLAQSGALVALLSPKVPPKNETDVPKPDTTIDSNTETDYNTEESEKK